MMEIDRAAAMEIDRAAAEEFSDAIADVMCWFRGFKAAHAGAEYEAEYPPNLDRLMDLKIKLDGVE